MTVIIAATNIFWRWSSRIDVDYQVIVETGQAGINSNVILCIHGEETTTANLALRTIRGGSEGKFTQNSRLEFDLKATDVGKVGDCLEENESEPEMKMCSWLDYEDQYWSRWSRWRSTVVSEIGSDSQKWWALHVIGLDGLAHVESSLC